jgi:hypothetical protein
MVRLKPLSRSPLARARQNGGDDTLTGRALGPTTPPHTNNTKHGAAFSRVAPFGSPPDHTGAISIRRSLAGMGVPHVTIGGQGEPVLNQALTPKTNVLLQPKPELIVTLPRTI